MKMHNWYFMHADSWLESIHLHIHCSAFCVLNFPIANKGVGGGVSRVKILIWIVSLILLSFRCLKITLDTLHTTFTTRITQNFLRKESLCFSSRNLNRTIKIATKDTKQPQYVGTMQFSQILRPWGPFKKYSLEYTGKAFTKWWPTENMGGGKISKKLCRFPKIFHILIFIFCVWKPNKLNGGGTCTQEYAYRLCW